LRRGQLRRCYLHILVLHGTYEDRNFFIQHRKLNNAESVTELTDEDIERVEICKEEDFHAIVRTELEEELH
jgi:hypothetical protein